MENQNTFAFGISDSLQNILIFWKQITIPFEFIFKIVWLLYVESNAFKLQSDEASEQTLPLVYSLHFLTFKVERAIFIMSIT